MNMGMNEIERKNKVKSEKLIASLRINIERFEKELQLMTLELNCMQNKLSCFKNHRKIRLNAEESLIWKGITSSNRRNCRLLAPVQALQKMRVD